MVTKITPEQYKNEFYKTARRIARTRKTPFTVNDIVAKVGTPPQGRQALSGLMTSAVNNLGLSYVGDVPSTIPTRRGAYVSAWSL